LLIIFDLDDTLIDTTNSITRIKLEDALTRMIEAGLSIPNVPDAVEMLKRLDGSSITARDTLAEFLEIHDADPKYLEIGLRELYGEIALDVPVYALDQAHEVLADLSASHKLALVTVGNADRQMAKLKKAGIDSALFSKIVMTEERNKKPHYEAIVEEFSASPSEVIVCGDRISMDLTPAKELGFKTIQMRWGRGLVNFGNRNDVDFTISRLAEIKDIIITGIDGNK
jgi:putative hydrolase of the HAD superfamily